MLISNEPEEKKYKINEIKPNFLLFFSFTTLG